MPPAGALPDASERPSPLALSERLTLVAAVATTLASLVVYLANGPEVARFVLAGLALAAVAAAVGVSIEEVGRRLGPEATGLLQSTLGNLPEFFVGIFALREGLVNVVRAALVGSVLSNALLVLGAALLAGGLRHGIQRFDPSQARLHASLLLLAVGAWAVPTLASRLNTPAAAHTGALSDTAAVVLLVVYLSSIGYSLRAHAVAPAEPAAQSPPRVPARPTPVPGTSPGPPGWSLSLALAVLVSSSAAAALVSELFVGALKPAVHALGLSSEFTGLVVVAIASNAVEHAVGVRFALRAKPEYVISTVLNSALQVALLLTPALVLLSAVISPHPLSLVFPGLLIAAVALGAVVVMSVIYDGEYTWIEGVALIGLYAVVAAAFWWG